MPIRITVSYPSTVVAEDAAAITRVLSQLLVTFGFAGINRSSTRVSTNYRECLSAMTRLSERYGIELDITPQFPPEETE